MATLESLPSGFGKLNTMEIEDRLEFLRGECHQEVVKFLNFVVGNSTDVVSEILAVRILNLQVGCFGIPEIVCE